MFYVMKLATTALGVTLRCSKNAFKHRTFLSLSVFVFQASHLPFFKHRTCLSIMSGSKAAESSMAARMMTHFIREGYTLDQIKKIKTRVCPMNEYLEKAEAQVDMEVFEIS